MWHINTRQRQQRIPKGLKLKWLPRFLALVVCLLLAGCVEDDAVWLPDSSGFIYIRGDHKLMHYDLAKKAEREVLSLDWLNPLIGRPAVSPDGKQIALARYTASNTSECLRVTIFDLSGREIAVSPEIPLARHHSKQESVIRAARAFWSPDGKRLLLSTCTGHAMSTSKSGAVAIYTISDQRLTLFDDLEETGFEFYFSMLPFAPDSSGFFARAKAADGDTGDNPFAGLVLVDWDGYRHKLRVSPQAEQTLTDFRREPEKAGEKNGGIVWPVPRMEQNAIAFAWFRGELRIDVAKHLIDYTPIESARRLQEHAKQQAAMVVPMNGTSFLQIRGEFFKGMSLGFVSTVGQKAKPLADVEEARGFPESPDGRFTLVYHTKNEKRFIKVLGSPGEVVEDLYHYDKAELEKDTRRRPYVILLVHGITMDVYQPSEVWGRLVGEGKDARWSGMIGFLEKRGFRFGGVIRARGGQLKLPESLSTAGGTGDVRSADFFALQFTPQAAEDGVTAKVMELSTCISQLRGFTGADKVRIVAHSVGGVVTRAYLQNAVPGAAYQHDVDRVITIGTPHLGSGLVEHFGDFLGTRVTSLKPRAAMTLSLNRELDLPTDVDFASIVVRSIWDDVSGSGDDYTHLVDHEFLKGLPIDYRQGGDGVLNVRTQNLRLADCAKRYEQATCRAVQQASARVAGTKGDRAHTAALNDEDVQEWVNRFLSDDGDCWKGPADWRRRGQWIDQGAVACAAAIVEAEAIHAKGIVGVYAYRVETGFSKCDGPAWYYHFLGEAKWRGKLLGINEGRCRVAGTLRVVGDRYGRIIDWGHSTSECREMRENEADDTSVSARLQRASAHLARAEYVWAINEYAEVLRGDPESTSAKQGLCSVWTGLGKAYSGRRDWESAFDAYARAIATGNAGAGAYCGRAIAADRLRRYAQAAEDYGEALRQEKNSSNYNFYAWFMATCPDPQWRNGKKAMEYARKACQLTRYRDADCLDTLAAACAEEGQYDEAANWEKEAIGYADSCSEAQREGFRSRLKMYKTGKPFHETR